MYINIMLHINKYVYGLRFIEVFFLRISILPEAYKISSVQYKCIVDLKSTLERKILNEFYLLSI